MLAVLVAMLLAGIRALPVRAFQLLVAAIVEYHRNVPVLVQILIWYFAVPQVLPDALRIWVNRQNSEFLFSMIALALNTGAFMSEDLRSGLRAVPSGQFDAARSVGLSVVGALRYVMLPQAIRIAVPAMINQTVFLFKNTSLAMAVAVGELTYRLHELENATYRTFEIFMYSDLPGIFVQSDGPGRLVQSTISLSVSSLSMLDILRDFGLLFLLGSYPQGPLGGLAGTLLLSTLGLLLSFPLALALGLMRTSKQPWLLWPASAWVYTLRGLPLLMLIFWAYFGIPLLIGHEVSAFITVVCAIVIYESAFLSEIVRAGLEGLALGQTQAARAMGLTYFQTMRYVLLPQALTNMLPSLLNQFVSIIKATSLAYVVGVHEVTLAASQVNSMLLTKPMQVFLILAAMYFILCFSLSRGANALERHLAQRRGNSN